MSIEAALRQRAERLAPALAEVVRGAAERVPGFAARLAEAGTDVDEVCGSPSLSALPVLSKDELVERQQADPPHGGLLAPDAQVARWFQSPGPLYEPQLVGADWRWGQALGDLGVGEGDIVLLENLRFNAGETSKDATERTEFARQLAELADCYVSDGFGVVHRAQASVHEIAQLLPAAAGDLVQTEVEVMQQLTESPERPYAVVLGGAKVSDKLGVIDNLIGTADRLLIGGGMVFTFLAAQGHEVGKSLLEADQVEACKGYLEQAEAQGVEIVLPTDVVAATEFSAEADHEVVGVDAIAADRMGLDIGPASARLFAEKLSDCRTVFWNGPMGAFEMEPYAAGTRAVAQALVDITRDGALTVVGGGDSAAAVRQLGFADEDFGHISTGGGASLEYLEGKELPGLAVLA